MIFTKEAYQSAKFQTFDCSGEISPNLYFDRLLLLKVYKISAKKVQRSYVSWYWRMVKNLKKTDFLFQKWQEFGEFWSKRYNLHFDWSLLYKVYNVWPKNVQRIYISWHRSFKRFEEKLTCGLENDMRNLANFHQNIWKCQNWYFHPFVQSRKCMS